MPDNCEELQKVCHTRIKKQTQTASIAYDLRHCCLGIRINKSKNNQIESFTDKKFHNFLQRNNISKSSPEKDLSGKDIGTEWFKISSQKAINFLNQYKGGNEILSNKNKIEIKFRPEQKEVIQKTAECYIDSINKNKEEGKMLWDAIMRFGKTLCTYAFIDKVNREYGNIIKKVLILTHRPDVNKGWFEEFQNYFINLKSYLINTHIIRNIKNMVKIEIIV